MRERERPDGKGRSAAPKRPVRSLKQRALGYLARRDYARAELRERLLHQARAAEPADAAAVDALLDELTGLGYLSDTRYAQALVARRAASHSRRAIAEELAARGVVGEAAAAALAQLVVDDADSMRELWSRKFARAPADEREKSRQIRFLQSRGFRLSEILKFLRELARAAPAE